MEIVTLIIAFLIVLFISVGGFLLQRDRYWYRKWEEVGRPNVHTIDEFKKYIKDNCSV